MTNRTDNNIDNNKTNQIVGKNGLRIKKYKKLEIIDEKIFEIPTYNQHEIFLNKNYRISLLKEICRHYKIRVSGSKPILINRIYNHLILSKTAVIIQKNGRRYLRSRYNKLLGPALFNRQLCKNDKDLLTFDNVKDILYKEFISYKDNDGNIWGYNIKTLYNLFIKSKGNVISPYTREKIGYNIFYNIKNIIKLSKAFNDKINLSLNEDNEILSQKKKLELRCLELFQYIDELGNYTDIKWFLSLNKTCLIQFIRELMDIWEYRAVLSETVKKEICYPGGNPFRYINMNNINEVNFSNLQKICLTLINQFIKMGINKDSCALGASYVLCALTLVNHDAATALPWLYQSVANID